MKKRTIILLLISFLPIFFYLIILGGPISKTLSKGNCKVVYTYFITNNFYNVIATHGHAPSNKMERENATSEIGRCLCERYVNKKNEEDSTLIIELINTNERFLTNFRRLREEKKIAKLTLADLCANKEELFSEIHLK